MWLNGSTYEIPNYMLLFSALFFIVILFGRRKKEKVSLKI